jgi:glycerol kinase
MEKDSGSKLKSLAVDGGMSNSELCMQTQADLVGIPLIKPDMSETTALGAAIAAGYAIGIWRSLEDAKSVNARGTRVFNAQMGAEKSSAMYARWGRAVEMSRGWIDKV